MDPRGHDLLAERLNRIPPLLLGALATPLPLSPSAAAGRRFVVTGTGSSEAHARYLAYLLNRYAGVGAEFLPLSGFCRLSRRFFRDKVLAVVSQGLSPNAQVALDHAGDFAHTVVFTATTRAGAVAAGKTDRADLIARLEDADVEFVRGPLEEEYSTLIRFVGPMACYLSIYQFVRGINPQALPPVTADYLASLLDARAPNQSVAYFRDNAAALRRGFYVVTASPLCEFAQNLAYKFLEGLFWSSPVIWDFLQFAHGPFQEVTLQPRPVLIIQGPDSSEADLAERTRRMLGHAELPHHTLQYRARHPLAIVELEAMVNSIVFPLIRDLNVDQIHWPSRGKDDPLYGFYRVG